MTELTFIEEWPMQGREGRISVGATIGRTGCDVELSDPDVSRRHAVVRAVGDGVAIEDLDSTNGTFVNDQRISRVTELRDGDKVRFGNTIWRVRGRQVVSEETHVTGTPPVEETRISPEPISAEQLPPREDVASGAALKAETEATPAAAKPESGRPDSMPSVIRRALPADAPAGTARAFSPPAARSSRGSAARRLDAAVASYAVVLATAIAVAVYLTQR